MPNVFVFSVSAFFGPFWSVKPPLFFSTWLSETLTLKHGMKCCLTLELQPRGEDSSVGEHVPRMCEEDGEEKGEIKIVKSLKLNQ